MSFHYGLSYLLQLNKEAADRNFSQRHRACLYLLRQVIWEENLRTWLVFGMESPENIFSLVRYKFGLDKSYERIWAIYDFQFII